MLFQRRTGSFGDEPLEVGNPVPPKSRNTEYGAAVVTLRVAGCEVTCDTPFEMSTENCAPLIDVHAAGIRNTMSDAPEIGTPFIFH